MVLTKKHSDVQSAYEVVHWCWIEYDRLKLRDCSKWEIASIMKRIWAI